ncbi:MAG: vWA domain-containing protein [Candidatus Kerfeldbacteria bacterium]
MSIIDYDDTVSYEGTSPQGTTGEAIAAQSLDLNNVLYVSPQNSTQSGAETGLGDSIISDQEYTVTFDAKYVTQPDDTDFIQIGIQHGTNTADVDFFEVGSAMADIVFVVDASSSMAPYIENIADASSDFANNLANTSIDAQMAIVTTGGYRQPAVVDFGEGELNVNAGNDYGADDGVDVSFTTSPIEFSSYMNAIKDSPDGGWVYNYNALEYIAENRFPDIGGGADVELAFRPGAQRFVILLTDAPPEEGDSQILSGDPDLWEPEDEAQFEPQIPASAYTLFSIVDYSVGGFSDYPSNEAYDSLTSKLGGEMFDITLTDYSTILDAVVQSIDDATSNFKFTNYWESYALGPITIEHKDEPTDESDLFFGQTDGSGDTPFIIDNVSLKPAIEVNMENNPHTNQSSWLIGRTCRGYPEEDSEFCNYQEPNGAFYNGWKGYCLEKDEIDHNKCVLWWPVDIISGEPDSSNRLKIQYTGKYPVYHCLVAKGNAELGACSSGGQMCWANSDCTSGHCIAGEDANNYTYTAPSPDESTVISSSDYTVVHTIEDMDIDTASPHANSADGTKIEAAKFRKLVPTPVEKLIHISEIDRIVFDMGHPKVSHAANPDEVENSYRAGAQGFNTATFEDPANLTDLAEAAWQYGSGEVAPAFENEGSGTDENAVYAYQRGFWCGDDEDDVCTLSGQNSIADNYEDMDIVFVAGVTSATAGGGQEVKEGDRVMNNGVPLSPFHDRSDPAATPLAPKNGDMWDNGGVEGTFEGTGDDNDFPTTATVDDVYFSQYFSNRYSGASSPGGGNDTCFDSTAYLVGQKDCGANIMGIDFDFEDGYLQNIYLFYWDGFRRFDIDHMEDITWTYFLREPCLLAVEGADENANAVPWQERAQQNSNYIVPLSGTYGFSYDMENANSMFGSMGASSDEEPYEVDGVQSDFTDAFVDFTGAAGFDLPYARLNAGSGSVLPYACIGRCENVRGDGDHDASFDDGSYLWPGFDGVCDTTTTDGEAVLCTEDTICPSSGTCQHNLVSEDGLGSSYTSYRAQLNAAATVAWERYRLLFADIGDDVYYAPRDPNDSDRWIPYRKTDDGQNTDYSMAHASPGDDALSWLDALDDGFNTMPECAGDTRAATDYCGFRPTIDNITANNNDTGDLALVDGSSVTLRFDSHVDDEQEPLQSIRIAWEGREGQAFSIEDYMIHPWEAASINGHYYTHTYTCDPTSSYYVSDVGACVYNLKIQIEDNWKFCSGESYADVGVHHFLGLPNAVTRSVNGECTSYDSYDGTIYIYP